MSLTLAIVLNFEEKFIADEKERLKYLLTQFMPLLARDHTSESQENHQVVSGILKQNLTHTELLEELWPVFATPDAKPKQLVLADDVERNLGPNRSAEYLGLHADISYMVVKHLTGAHK